MERNLIIKEIENMNVGDRVLVDSNNWCIIEKIEEEKYNIKKSFDEVKKIAIFKINNYDYDSVFDVNLQGLKTLDYNYLEKL